MGRSQKPDQCAHCQEGSNKKVILVSRDINMRVKCDSLGIPTEDYAPNRIVAKTNELYTGFKTHLVDDQVIDQFYTGEDIFLEKEVRQSK